MYFIGYLYNGNKVKPLNIVLHKTSAYVKSYGGLTKWRYFLIEDVDWLEKYNNICDKASADIKKELGSEPVCKKIVWKPKKNLMAMNLQIFTIKKFQS